MKRAAIYVRVSSDRQAQEGDSIPAQLDALRKWVKDKGHVLVDEYVDDGVSGQKVQRDELQRLLDDVKADRIELIAFTKLDRWFRSIRHYMNTQELLDKHGVDWVAIWEPFYDTTTPQGRLIVSQMMSIAQFEAENTGSRIRQVFNYKIMQGEVVTGRTPFGYCIMDKHLVPDENACIVKDLFERFDFVGSVADVGRYAMEQYGLVHTHATWRRMLKKEIYIGRYRGREGYCQPIISPQLFDSVQRKLKSNIKDVKKRDTYLFTGLLICPVCGAVMTGTHIRYKAADGSVRRYRAYRCTKGTQPGQKHPIKQRFESTLERFLVSNVAELARREKLVKISLGQTDNKKEISQLRRKIDRLKDLYVDGLIELDEYRADKERFMTELASLEARRPSNTAMLDKISSIDFESLYDTFTDVEKAYLWHSIIKQIYWDDNGIRPVFLD